MRHRALRTRQALRSVAVSASRTLPVHRLKPQTRGRSPCSGHIGFRPSLIWPMATAATRSFIAGSPGGLITFPGDNHTGFTDAQYSQAYASIFGFLGQADVRTPSRPKGGSPRAENTLCVRLTTKGVQKGGKSNQDRTDSRTLTRLPVGRAGNVGFGISRSHRAQRPRWPNPTADPVSITLRGCAHKNNRDIQRYPH